MHCDEALGHESLWRTTKALSPAYAAVSNERRTVLQEIAVYFESED